MKSYLLVFIPITVFCSIMHAQEQIPVIKKVSVGENKRLYVNRDLGLYLWLSTSPDENAQKIRLKSDTTRSYTNPMYFDTEGYNTFRSPSAVDTTTKKVVYPLQDIIFEVYSDSKAPVTKVIISGDKSRTARNKKIFSEVAEIELKAYDATSGIDKTYYSLSNKPYEEYTGQFSIDSIGQNILKYYSIDKVGNREEEKKVEVMIE